MLSLMTFSACHIFRTSSIFGSIYSTQLLNTDKSATWSTANKTSLRIITLRSFISICCKTNIWVETVPLFCFALTTDLNPQIMQILTRLYIFFFEGVVKNLLLWYPLICIKKKYCILTIAQEILTRTYVADRWLWRVVW